MQDIRAQLDALMGQDRDLPPEERSKRRSERKFSDPDVCKHYLCGFCPYEEFRRTKNDVGDCPCVHDEGCRKQWEALEDRAKERYGYEADLLRWFDRLLGDLRKRIDGNSRRLESNEAPAILLEDQQRLDNLAQQANDLLARAATLGEQGEVDASQAAAAEAEALKAQRASYEASAQARARARLPTNLHQQVCPISGLIINNEESRLQDHYAGRNYNSWKKLHEVHAQLLEAQRQRRPAGFVAKPAGDVRGDRDNGRRDERPGRRDDRDRDRRRRSRSRDRRRRSRSRSRDRRRRSRSRERHFRSRSRERRRSRDPRLGGSGERRRSRSRDRAAAQPEAGELPPSV